MGVVGLGHGGKRWKLKGCDGGGLGKQMEGIGMADKKASFSKILLNPQFG